MRQRIRRAIGLPASWVPMGQAQKSLVLSIWLYFKEVFLRWQWLVGIIISAVLQIGLVRVGFGLDPRVWVAVFIVAYAIANVIIFHEHRSPTTDESLGMPLWASGALNSRGDGSHLTVVLFGFPPKKPFDTTTDYQRIVRATVQHFALDENKIVTNTHQGGLSIGFPNIPSPEFHAQFGVEHSGAIKVKSRMLSLPLAVVMSTFDNELRFVTSDVNRYVIDQKKRILCILSLSDWPYEGVDATGVLKGSRLSNRPTNGYSVNRTYLLGKKADAWEITKNFVAVCLADSGYAGFEPELSQLTRKDIGG